MHDPAIRRGNRVRNDRSMLDRQIVGYGNKQMMGNDDILGSSSIVRLTHDQTTTLASHECDALAHLPERYFGT
jgi:hypothetical protein